MRFIFLFFALAFSLSTIGQIRIGNHVPFYDETTQTLLFVTDSSSIHDLTATVSADADSAWADIRIGGGRAGNSFYFGDVSEDRTFTLTATKGGSLISRKIHFTCLPVLNITKTTPFSRKYEQATILMDCPGGSKADTLILCNIKTRGGSTNSAGRHKLNYSFKIISANGDSKDMSLLGMRDDNKWILDAGQVDFLRVRNKIAHNLWLDFSKKPYYFVEEPKAANGCHNRLVEVFINNEYRGIYNLMETVNRKQLKLKKYKSKDGVHGLLYKAVSWIGTKFEEPVTESYSNESLTWAGWEVKYPKPGDDADTTDYRPLDNFIQFVVTTPDRIFKKDLEKWLDIPVFIDYTLFIQVINGTDNMGKNIYWSIYDEAKEEYRKFVPTPWDLDATFGQYWKNGDGVAYSRVSPTINLRSITNIDYRMSTVFGNEYTDSVESRYADLRKSWFDGEALASRFRDTYAELRKSGAANREQDKWSYDSDLGGNVLDWNDQLAYVEDWIAKRLAFLDAKYHYTVADGISNIRYGKANDKHDGSVYNLQGQKVSGTYRGIVVRKGKKYYQR